MFSLLEALMRGGLFLRAIMLALTGRPGTLATRLVVRGVSEAAKSERRAAALRPGFTRKRPYPRLPF